MSLRILRLLLIAVCLTVALFGQSQAGSYPRDGRFKQLDSDSDPWYYVDHQNWYIKAPDKWTHYMGTYALTEITHQIVRDKTLAGVFALGMGLLKEVDDGYREGWSRRDLLVDVGGVASSMFLPSNMKLLAYYDDSSVMFKLSLIVP